MCSSSRSLRHPSGGARPLAATAAAVWPGASIAAGLACIVRLQRPRWRKRAAVRSVRGRPGPAKAGGAAGIEVIAQVAQASGLPPASSCREP